MKILFIISVHSHGRGGHFHSLNHISSVLSKENEVRIISIGPGKSSVLENNSNYFENTYFNGLNLTSLKRSIGKITKNYNPDIYHCFDIGSYNIIRLFISSKFNKLVVNKCGGPNPVKYPFVPNLVLFSVENLEWFNSNLKYQATNISLIPNRVKAISKPLNNLKNRFFDSQVFSFVRISRIGVTYLKGLIDSMNLVNELAVQNVGKIRLIIIGTIESHKVYDFLIGSNQFKQGNVVILTDEESTKEASNMLYLADAVIGTGRGLMESASLSLPVLAINSNGSYPVLLNENNFDYAFRTNFSERNIFQDYDESQNLKEIQRIITCKESYLASSVFSYSVFKKYFDLEIAKHKYLSVYKKSIFTKRYIIQDYNFIIKSLTLFLLSSIKINKK